MSSTLSELLDELHYLYEVAKRRLFSKPCEWHSCDESVYDRRLCPGHASKMYQGRVRAAEIKMEKRLP